nr:MAG TPA: hypothetical protein [Caudoviricetes sp.]
MSIYKDFNPSKFYVRSLLNLTLLTFTRLAII